MRNTVKTFLRAVFEFVPNQLQRQRRIKRLRKEQVRVSKEDIEVDLDSIPIPAGAVVLVHSSLKAIGFVDGGPTSVVQALINSIVEKRNGTLMFPTYSINGTMHNTLKELNSGERREFNVLKTPSNLGAIPEVFRNWPGVIRSVHPTHSFCALGPLAEELTRTHHTCGSSFGVGSPMARMLDHDSWLIGLGTNLGNVTMYHCLEDIEEDFPIDVYTPDSPLLVDCKDWSGNVHKLRLFAHDGGVARTRIDRPENVAVRRYYTERFEQEAGLTWHQVCQAKTWFISANQLYRESARLMRDNLTIYTAESQLRERGVI